VERRETVKVSVVMILRDQKILIAKRPDGSHLAGRWEFPGGKCLPGEPPEACAIREVREEIGVEVDLIQRWGEIEHDYPERRVRLYPFVARITSGEPLPLGCTELAWVAREKLLSYRFPEANRPLLERLKDGFEFRVSGLNLKLER
jgi:mutator protein MutT